MRVLTINELWQLSKYELSALSDRMVTLLLTLPKDSVEGIAVRNTLRNIGLTLSRRNFTL